MSSTEVGEPSVRIAVFASGSGTNALRIIEHFSGIPEIEVALCVCNKPRAGVLEHAHANHVPSLIVTRRLLKDRDFMQRILVANRVDFIALAGFLLLIPEYLVQMYPDRIINIHPALLPAFGGKGMYGMHVHRAVKAAGETESGITIHLVNPVYDDGRIIAQERVPVDPLDTPEDIARKVQVLEHRHYPYVIEDTVRKIFKDRF